MSYYPALVRCDCCSVWPCIFVCSVVVAVAANEAVRLRLLVLELELEFECVLDMKNKVWLHMPTSVRTGA